MEISQISIELKPSGQSRFQKLNFAHNSKNNTQKQISRFSFPVQFYWISLFFSKDFVQEYRL